MSYSGVEDRTGEQMVGNPSSFYQGQMPMGAPTSAITPAVTPIPPIRGTPGAKVDMGDFLSPDKQITRSVVMNWIGSLREWETGVDSAPLVWKVDANDLDIFRAKRRGINSTRSDRREGDLTKVLVIGARVKYISNPTPVDIGVRITGLKGNKYAGNMNMRFPVYMFSKEKGRSNDVAHVPDPYIEAFPELIRQYGHVTRAGIESKLVRFPDDSSTLVRDDSVIAQLMELNQEALNIDMSRSNKIDGRYYKVTNDVVEKCLEELDKNVLQKQPYVNLENFSATLVRADGRSWMDTKGADVDHDDPDYTTALQKAQNNVKLELELTYVICDEAL